MKAGALVMWLKALEPYITVGILLNFGLLWWSLGKFEKEMKRSHPDKLKELPGTSSHFELPTLDDERQWGKYIWGKSYRQFGNAKINLYGDLIRFLGYSLLFLVLASACLGLRPSLNF